jgi:hypothetical protein
MSSRNVRGAAETRCGTKMEAQWGIDTEKEREREREGGRVVCSVLLTACVYAMQTRLRNGLNDAERNDECRARPGKLNAMHRRRVTPRVTALPARSRKDRPVRPSIRADRAMTSRGVAFNDDRANGSPSASAEMKAVL